MTHKTFKRYIKHIKVTKSLGGLMGFPNKWMVNYVNRQFKTKKEATGIATLLRNTKRPDIQLCIAEGRFVDDLIFKEVRQNGNRQQM